MPSATKIDGNKVAATIREQIRTELTSLDYPSITLATVLVGENPASQLYVGMKHTQAQSVGFMSKHVQLDKDIPQDELETAIRALANDDSVHGILIQMPLPGHLDMDAILALVPPEKDVDGLTKENLGYLLRGRKRLVPCTPLGVMRLLQAYDIQTQGKRAVVVGRSVLVGLPQMILLTERGVDATATLAHSRTDDLAAVCREADILVSAVGSPGLITQAHVKPGAVVFDVGVTRTPEGIRGDVDYTAVQDIASAVTPMPGGTGPMTVACLLANTLTAAKLQLSS